MKLSQTLLIPIVIITVSSLSFAQNVSKPKQQIPEIRGLFDGAEYDHFFPQFLNGPIGGGVLYSTTISVLPFIETSSTAITCSLKTYGTSITMNNFGTQNTFNFTLAPNGGWNHLSTNPNVPALELGYATLSCSDGVYAIVEFSLYEQSKKTGGATVFSNGEWESARYIADTREAGSRLGIAVANNTDLPRTYRLTVSNAGGTPLGNTQFTIPGRTSQAKFLDELISGTSGILTLVTIESIDHSDFSSIGLRFVGPVFNTIPSAQ